MFQIITSIVYLLINFCSFASSTSIATDLDDKLPVYLKIDESNLENNNSLNINWCETNTSNYCRTPNRDLQLSGQKITKGIIIEPKIEGEWRFSDNNYGITFIPKNYWLAGTSYKVTLDKGILPYFLLLNQYTISFQTKPLLPRILEMQYLQDPNDINKKFVQTKLIFNYPIEQKSLQSSIVFSSSLGSKTLPFSTVFNNDNTEVNLVTEIKALEKEEKIVSVVVKEGLKPNYGGIALNYNAINAELKARAQRYSWSQESKPYYLYKEQVLIPNIYSYFKVTAAEIKIIKNDQYIPEQILVVQLNAPATSAEVKRNLELVLLPQDKPASFVGGFSKKDYQWLSTAEITKEVLENSQAVVFEVLPNAAEYSTIHSFKVSSIPSRYLLFKLKQGMRSYGDFVLGKDYDQLIVLPDFAKEIKILSEGSILSLSGEHKLSIYSLGIDKLHVEIGRINSNNINHLVSQTYKYGKFENPVFKNWEFNEYNIAQIFEEDIALNNSKECFPQYSTLDLSKYLTEKNKTADNKGLFFVNISYVDPKSKQTISDKRFILVTDIGFMVKTNQDGSQNIFVSSIRKGAPLKGVKVGIIGLNGQEIAAGETNGAGHLLLPSLSGFNKEKAPVAYIMKYGNDLSFMPYGRIDREVNYSKFEVSGILTSPEGLKAYLFSDRGIYRPGEQGNIGIIIKQANLQNSFAGLPLELEVTNPRGQIIDNQKIKLNQEGFVDYVFKTRDSSPTGNYNIFLYITKDGYRGSCLGSVNVRVEEFMPDRMKITSSFAINSQKLWVKPESLTATVDLINLYGTPAVKKKIAAKINLVPTAIVVPGFKDYSFYSGISNNKDFIQQLNDTLTDEQGRADFVIDLKNYKDTTYRMNFIAEGFDTDSGRSVSTMKSIMVSSLPYVLGLKANGDLEYINQQDKRQIEFIAIDSEAKKIATAELVLQLKKIDYVNSLTKQHDGSYAYQSLPVESLIDQNSISVPVAGYSYNLPTSNVGDYVIYIIDQDQNKLAQANFTIVGEGNVAAKLTKSNILKVKTNKTDYKAGDELEVNIIAPYTGYGLLTIETNKVHSFNWFKANSTNSVQKIKIPEDFEGKGFLNIQFMRSRESKEIFTSPFSYASVPFTANIDRRSQKITLNVPKIVKPGSEYIVEYSTKQAGKIAVFAIDEGILLFGKYKTPDPIGYFIKNRALEVNTSHTLDLILPEYSMLKMNAAVGGDGFINDGKNLNPFKRKDQPAVVFWSGIIDSSMTPQKLKFNIPDYFNGTLRVMAVAVANDAVGSAEATSIVQGDFVINPNIPLFVTPKDEFIMPVTIANNITGSGNAKVKLMIEASEHLEIIEKPVDVLINEGKDNTVKVRIRAKDKLGAASIKITAISSDKRSIITTSTSVRPAAPKITTIDTAYVNDKQVDIPISRKIYPEFSQVDLSVSSLPIGIINGLQAYLSNYPYGCTEQIISKNFPNVLLYDQSNLVAISNNARKELDKTLNEVFMLLRERQNYDGSFNAWGRFGDADDFISVYAMHFLTEAAARNLPIPDDVFKSGMNYLKNMANRSINSLNEAREKSYAIYVLTRNNEITTNYLANVINYLEAEYKDSWHNDLAAVYIAASYRMLQMVPEANVLLDKFIVDAKAGQPSLEYNFYNKLIKYSQYIYLLSQHFSERLKSLDKKIVYGIANLIAGSNNTIASSYAIMASIAYTNAIDDVAAGIFKVTMYDAQGMQQTQNLSDDLIKTAANLQSAAKLTLSSDIPGFFYQLLTSGFDRELDKTESISGLELQKQYLDDQGKEVKTVQLGDVVNVLVTIRSGSDRDLSNIAVVDLLPGGFELQNAVDQKTIGSPWNVFYVDRREDRIIMFGTAPTQAAQYKYQIKAVNRGNVLTPAIYGESMYIPTIYYRGTVGDMIIE
ncbi:alpha-2-macroglobulin family protein [Candidatus Trichorickettsia mobilis]|uniref:alpha-2-macroglobulin family protein n=1 Tax=Candidatus Trichorickettsia mobilis TaxID=1346319 RepID=UPI00292D37D6|nr:alpha-2-macroglobulin [Candidatus Trichorickettsia mobilis]